MKNHKLFFVILCVGVFFRFFLLTQQSLWGDEIYIVGVLKLPLIKMTEFLWYEENHPPLYVILLKGWANIFGSSDAALRAFSALLSTWALIILYQFASLFLEKRAALLSMALFAISPFAIYYAQEIRYYALWLPLTLSSFLYFYHWIMLKRPDYIKWAVVTAANLYTHIFSFLILFIQGFIFLVTSFKERKEKNVSIFSLWPRQFWLAFAFLIIGMIPLLWWLMLHVGNHTGYFREFSQFQLPYTFYCWVVGYSWGPSVTELHLMGWQMLLKTYAMPLIIAYALIAIVFTAGAIKIYEIRKLRSLWLTLAIAFTAILTTPLYSEITYSVRSTLFLVPFFYLILGVGCDHLLKNKFLRIFPILLVGLMLTSLYQYYYNPKYYRDDIRSSAEIIAQESEDIPVLSGIMATKAMLGHYRHSGKQVFFTYDKITPKDLESQEKIWVIWQRMWIYNNVEEYKKFFEKNYDVEKSYDIPGIKLQLMVKKDHKN